MAPTVIAFCEQRQLKGWQPHFQPTVVKSSISKTIHCFAVVTWNHPKSEYSSTRPRDHNSVTKKTLCFSACDGCFFCSWRRRDGHDATIMQSWYSQEPRCLESPEMDSLDEHVEKISVWQCVTFCEHGQLKGWQPRFQPDPLLLKAHCNSRSGKWEKTHSNIL